MPFGGYDGLLESDAMQDAYPGSAEAEFHSGRAAAAWTLWQQNWTAMAGTVPPPCGVHYPYPVSGPATWDDVAGLQPWDSWGDAPSWPWQGHPCDSSPYGADAGRGGVAEPAAAVAAWAAAADQQHRPDGSEGVDEKSLDSLQQLKGGPPAEPAPRAPSPPAAEGDALAQDIASAVQLFLAGEGDAGLSDSGSDAGDGIGGADRAQPPGAPLGAAEACATAAAVAPGPQTMAPPVDGRGAALLAGGQQGAPSPENVRDFLQVLRRRELGPELTEERLPVVKQLIDVVIRSLYEDRIRPTLGIVQRELRTRLPVELRQVESAVERALLPLCARDPERYRVVPPARCRPPAILLAREPPGFLGWVDVEGREGACFGPEAWAALEAFLARAAPAPPSPRRLALELQRRGPPALSALSRGELEHLVRLGVGRGLLRCAAGRLEPCRGPAPAGSAGAAGGAGAAAPPGPPEARRGPEAPGAEAPRGDTADGEDLSEVLLQLMQRFPDGVSLSRMKHHVQSHCRRALDEAALRCTKLAEVFELPPLDQIPPPEQARQRNGLVARPPAPAAVAPAHWQKLRRADCARGAAQGPREPGLLPGGTAPPGLGAVGARAARAGTRAQPTSDGRLFHA